MSSTDNNGMTEPLNTSVESDGGGDGGNGGNGGNSNTAGDDNASQSSQRSGRSLIERIRAQREREAAAKAAATDGGAGGSSAAGDDNGAPTPTQINIPTYDPNPTPQNFGGGGPAALASDGGRNAATTASREGEGGGAGGGSSSFFSDAWNQISQSMENGMSSLEHEESHMEDALLLAPTSEQILDDEEYSVCGYFLTFVRDIYGGFLRIPLLIRIVLVIALLYAAWKLI